MKSGLQIKHFKKSIRERKNRQRRYDSDLSSIISQKGESQNGCFKKTKHAKFSEKWTFLTLWYPHVLIRIRRVRNVRFSGNLVRNVRFSENLACFVFLKHQFWGSLFCRITDVMMWFFYVESWALWKISYCFVSRNKSLIKQNH